MNIGWIGLGMIGTQMARRLIAAGHDVTVYARGSGLEEIMAAGAAATDDYRALGAGREVLGVCLFNDAQVREVLLDRGTLAAMRPGAIIVLHTTGSPALAGELGGSAPPGVDVLDATFSGGPGEVAAGTLTVMVGGSGKALERARPVLDSYAGQVHHVGPLGHGQTLKLLNNLLFAANVMQAAETLRLAEAQGFDPATVVPILQGCSGASFALGRFAAPRPLNAMIGSLRPYLEKDVAAAARSAEDAGLDIAAFEAVVEYFRAGKAS